VVGSGRRNHRAAARRPSHDSRPRRARGGWCSRDWL